MITVPSIQSATGTHIPTFFAAALWNGLALGLEAMELAIVADAPLDVG